jgi:hypothetical protein
VHANITAVDGKFQFVTLDKGSEDGLRQNGKMIVTRGENLAIARVEPGSLTPTLSRRERVSRPALGDMPEPRPSEPSRIAPANARLSPPKPAAHRLLLPPGEGRDEGRPLHSSRPVHGLTPSPNSPNNRA